MNVTDKIINAVLAAVLVLSIAMNVWATIQMVHTKDKISSMFCIERSN